MTFSLRARLKSFSHALAGIRLLVASQHNAWVHLAATAAVIGAGIGLRVSAEDWRWLVIAIVLVWACEAVNTAFEHLCDVVSPDFHPGVRVAKDVAAGAVLICALGAAVLGALVFLPYVSD